MGYQHSRVAPGRRLSRPHSCWLISSGGEHIIILCVPTNHFEWRSCCHKSEVANWRRDATGNGRKLRLRAEPIDYGRRARYSLTPCQRFPLERHRSQMRLARYVVRKSGKVTAKALGGSLASGRGGLTGPLKDQNPAQSWAGE